MTTAIAQPMAQRKPSPPTTNNTYHLNNDEILRRVSYGVPTPRRMLTPGTLVKKHDHIRTYLLSLGLTPAERDAAFYLLRLFVYYGKVYPKAPNYTEDCYCSKRTFWRAIAKLEQIGILDRIHRYLNHLQISNCYRLDKLILCLVRYLAEHGYPFVDTFTRAILKLTSNSFWTAIWPATVRLRDPKPITF